MPYTAAVHLSADADTAQASKVLETCQFATRVQCVDNYKWASMGLEGVSDAFEIGE